MQTHFSICAHYSPHGAVRTPVMQATRRVAWIIGVIAILSGCGPITDIMRPDDSRQVTTSTLAEQASEQRDHLLAAHEYNQLAATASSPQREDYQLRAVAALLDGGHTTAARQQIQLITTDGLAPVYGMRKQLQQARLAIADNEPDRALGVLLRIIPGPELAPEFRAAIHRVRAEAYTLTGNQLELARERIALEPLLATTQQVDQNHRIIWDALSEISPQVLERLQTLPPPDVLGGWMELVSLYQRHGNSTAAPALPQAIALWKQRYPGHPAARQFVDNIGTGGTTVHRYRRIALLLPLSGQFAKQATAIRDGLLAAYYHQSASERPQLRIYDINADDPASVNARYQQALSDGAQFIIGPLNKSSVNQLATASELAVPTLALNYSEATSTNVPHLFQFGLAPEDEARQAAERAWLDGHINALAIVPEGPWGMRVLNAFQARWQQLGGNLLEAQSYSLTNKDFSTPISHLLDVDASQRRIRAIQALTGLAIKHEPRRRQDADFIFMLGQPVQARQLRPQLKFHRASDLPVYSTSHVYSGKADPLADRDMNGAVFNDMPWLLGIHSRYQQLRQQLLQQFPDTDEQYVRLYALGIDAYHLLPQLGRLQQYQSARFPGETGSLSLDAQGRIHRQLVWARFIGGEARVLRDQLTPAL